MFDVLLREIDGVRGCRRAYPDEIETYQQNAAALCGRYFANDRRYRRRQDMTRKTVQYRVLSIRSPWVGAVACGLKPYEFRAWDQCRYRGPLLIHHSGGGTKKQQREAVAWIAERFGEEVATRCTRDDSITAGRIVAVVHVVDFVPLVRRVPSPVPLAEHDVPPAIRRWMPPTIDARAALVLAGAVRFLGVPHVGRLGIHYRELLHDSWDRVTVDCAIAESAAALRAGLEVTP